MGQVNSALQVNPENFDAVWIQRPSACSEFSPPQFPFEQKPVVLRDSALWDRFGKDVNQHSVLVNKYMWPLFIAMFVSYILLALGGNLFPRFKEDFSTEITIGSAAINVLILMAVFFGMYSVNQKNKKLDIAIEEVCTQYNVEFQRNGFSIEYRTKNTQCCKPKHARPMRVIVFKPNNVVTNQV
jgi:hypothetical protein